jgi:hypothetical protein
MSGNISCGTSEMPGHRTDSKVPEGRAVAARPADVRPLERAYFLDVLRDSHNSLGRHRAAIEVYRQAFHQQNTQIAHALCPTAAPASGRGPAPRRRS